MNHKRELLGRGVVGFGLCEPSTKDSGVFSA